MKELKITIFFLFIVCLSFNLLLSQEGRGEARLKGIVTDEMDNPIEGAKIELMSLDYNLKMSTISSKKGNWSFLGLGKTVVKIILSKNGYMTTIIPELKISGIKNPMQRIVLKKAANIKDIEKENPKMLYLKGEELYKQAEYRKALIVFKEFLKKQPKLYKIRVNIGNCYIKLKEFEKAIPEFKLVLEKLKQENSDLKGNKIAASIYASFGELYMDKNELEKAKEYFEKSIDIDPSSYTLSYNVAEIFFDSNKIEEAIKYYNLCIKVKPDWQKPYIKLAYCYINKGETKKAINYLNEFIKLNPETDPQTEVAKSLIKQLKENK